MAMTFDYISGNPPWKGHRHWVITGRMERFLAKDGYIAWVVPRLVFMRNHKPVAKWTKWLDELSMVDGGDSEDDFTKIECLSDWFVARRDGGHAFKDNTLNVPVQFDGRVVKLARLGRHEELRKKLDGLFNCSVIECILTDGTPSLNKRFATMEENERFLERYKGKAILLVNTSGSMAKRQNTVYLMETCTHGWLEPYVLAVEFDDVEEARRAFVWLKCPEGIAYIEAACARRSTINHEVAALFGET